MDSSGEASVPTKRGLFIGYIIRCNILVQMILIHILSSIFTSDPNPTALSDVYCVCLFTTIVSLAIQVACFDAIFDCITSMIGRLFNFHLVKSTPNNQTWKRRGFLIFILTLTSHFFTFSYAFIL